jgi:hypothetical protein
MRRASSGSTRASSGLILAISRRTSAAFVFIESDIGSDELRLECPVPCTRYGRRAGRYGIDSFACTTASAAGPLAKIGQTYQR